MSLPPRAEFFATLRTLAASLGADAGFSIDEIDDLRLAISEVVTSLVDRVNVDGERAADDRIDVSFELGSGGLRVTITTQRSAKPVQLDDLASSILDSVVDDAVVSGGQVTLVKLASEARVAAAADMALLREWLEDAPGASEGLGVLLG